MNKRYILRVYLCRVISLGANAGCCDAANLYQDTPVAKLAATASEGGAHF